ncbi:type II toxin-antitoxin system Phd/YefM family antitoxin [Granulicella tundricola]|uniref:Antitoxin n=1 Tax=Granulicella tundricola (strain ATCC BAA-1859 / DSM 23138 / MP5ACTX9) TaxID=1198114 RepID=E8WXD7_GRATM|nr:type II toxin-antitoxin system Phd/YefM family antitoxin [Granulicella tundricola]ADW67470.1 prevent-host-death family protein [Granulicella tundricola MP5ACTX9]
MATWGIAKAKAQLSELIYEAEKTGPQKVTRSGRDVAVVLSIDEWKRLATPDRSETRPQRSVWDVLSNSPLRGSNLKIPRRRPSTRVIDLSE